MTTQACITQWKHKTSYLRNITALSTSKRGYRGGVTLAAIIGGMNDSNGCSVSRLM